MGQESATNGSGAETTLQNRRELLRIKQRIEFELSRMGRESATNGNCREPLRIGDEWFSVGVCGSALVYLAEIKWLLGGFWLK